MENYAGHQLRPPCGRKVRAHIAVSPRRRVRDASPGREQLYSEDEFTFMRTAALLFTSLLVASVAGAASKADLNAKSLDGQKVRLKDLRGKLVVLNFWATWCGPCREELPMLIKTAKASTNADLVFIAVSVDDSKTQVKVPDSARQFGISFPVWVGANGDDVYKSPKARRFRRRSSSIATEPLKRGCRERSARTN